MRPSRVALAAGAVVGAAAAAIALTVDVKEWMRTQLTVPRGWSGRLAALTMPMFHKMFYGPAAERLALRSDDRLLEVACGSGVFLDQHAGHVASIAGIDLSDIQVERARRRLADRIAAGTAEISLGDAATVLPWEDGTFTAVTCIGSLEYFADPAAALGEMWRVLEPGGRIVVTWGLDESNEQTVREMDAWGIPHPPEADTRKVMEEAGFALVSVSYLTGGYPVRFLHGVKPG